MYVGLGTACKFQINLDVADPWLKPQQNIENLFLVKTVPFWNYFFYYFKSVAFFSSVEIDTCLRKDPRDDCVTPSNPDGMKLGYGIEEGQSLTIEDILRRTGGSLE